MKKVLLSSVAALAVFAAAAPAFASDNSYSSNALIQKHYVSERDIADEANTQVAAHEAEINAEAENYPTVVAARQALEAYGSGHLYGDYVAKLEAARTEARNVVRNKYVANLQDQYRAAAQREGKYWNDPTGVQDNKTKDMRDQEDKALNHGGSADAADANGQLQTKLNLAKTKVETQLKLVKLVQNKLVKLFQKQAQLNNLIIN